MKTFGITGFGRIGRNSLRVWWENHRDSLELKAINTSGSMDLKGWAHLLKYDTSYGQFKGKISFEEQQTKDKVSDENPVLGILKLDDYEVVVTAQRDPIKIPWSDYGVEIVVEATGAFRTEDTVALHLEGKNPKGAKKVVISAPAKGGNVEMGVLGVNDLNSEANIHSNASCTTNCVAPVAQIMVKSFGVEKAMLTTIHAYTDDQSIQDNSHKDLRRTRAAAENIIPTGTGAAKATGQIIPELAGMFDGVSIRIPILTGSLIDTVFLLKKDTTKEEVNKVFEEAAKTKQWKGILTVTHDPIVSSDIVGRPESSIVDLALTQVVGGNLVKVFSWYDNEWGYAHRLVEQVVGL